MKSELIEARQAVLARLMGLRAAGRLDSASVRMAAAALDVSERTVWRWLNSGAYAPQSPTAWKLTEEAISALYAAGGRPAIAWRMLRDGNQRVPSLPTFSRAVTSSISAAERAYMSTGEAGRRRYSVYRRWEPGDRNDVWEADHAQLDILVRVPRWRDPVRPWLTVLIDGFSRVIMGWVLSIQPTTAEVLTAIREGIVVNDARGPWGGVPDLIRFDGGKEFLADAVTRSSGRLGFAALPTPPYSPQKKGKVERLHRTIGEGLIAGLPHYTHGPRKANDRLYAQPQQLTLATLQDAVRRYIDDYNHRHEHRSLGGLTPAQKWDESSRVIETVPTEHLRWMLMSDSSRTVNKDGIHFNSVTFIAPELAGIGGEMVEVRYMPHDLRTIEVFQEGSWLCTAFPQDQVSEELAAAFLAQRAEINTAMGARRASAGRDRGKRLAPITAEGPIEDLPPRRTARRTPAELTNARVDRTLKLLNLGEQLNSAERPPDAGEPSV